MQMDRNQLADFLRRSRERLRPQEVGLPAGPRRRTPGLRREEVSQLAGMSADYYMRLEQARSPQPSPQILASLAHALRLTEDERDHLYLLAGHRPPAGRLAGDHVRPGLLYLLDQLHGTPAHITNDLGDLLAHNTMAEALLGCICSVREEDRNFIWRWFTDPTIRSIYPPEELDELGRTYVADLRASMVRRGNDAVSTRLVARLREVSSEFAALWDLHEVAVNRRSRVRVDHPAIGPIELECETLLSPAEDQRLTIFTPPPGTSNIDHLSLLRVLGHDDFTPAAPGRR
ncbi:helix-turn-helix transcriptional regulator [Actinoallomurus rhizosphaericola]|uniref:helix-turn-helix transcriptional regulator n=1 Tax=Actinoallomurus rhizosphaericola TaxID=2952536 RepID=UPI00209349A5|nr:helix-turn-helix transcriptional regulator [Actinoallomurus rhizosphaericola]MCO5997247.1 helix-turn-helix transcriptional regulator [Actinoallomurus rhizosphaericola]